VVVLLLVGPISSSSGEKDRQRFAKVTAIIKRCNLWLIDLMDKDYRAVQI